MIFENKKTKEKNNQINDNIGGLIKQIASKNK